MNPINSQNQKTVALYARVSTDQQSSGLEAQVRALKEYCQQNNNHHYELYCDENQSGAKVSRPALDRMMKAVQDGQISTVIVFAFSRFARSTTHLLSALNTFKEHKTEFVSITEKIETNSPMGLALFTILTALSTMEREILKEAQGKETTQETPPPEKPNLTLV